MSPHFPPPFVVLVEKKIGSPGRGVGVGHGPEWAHTGGGREGTMKPTVPKGAVPSGVGGGHRPGLDKRGEGIRAGRVAGHILFGS